jgi:hypothetical protein
MSVANALSFLRQLRADPGLRDRLQNQSPTDGVATLCQLAAAAGKPCEASELREAFWIEWAARAAHFTSRAAAAQTSWNKSPGVS